MEERCSVEKCPNAARTRGWCGTHYQRWLRSGTLEVQRKRSSKPRPKCSVDGCERDVLSRGWCVKHYNRWREHGDPVVLPPRKPPPPLPPKPPCKVDGCEQTSAMRGWCSRHYHRWARLGDPEAGSAYRYKQDGPCSIDGCEESAVTRGWCGRHYQRWRDYGDPEAPPRRARNGAGHRTINADGYAIWRFGNQTIMEHRLMMEQQLGRPMLAEETVHHRNGIRDDNDPSNLELWVSTRSGQRVADLIAFVVEHYRADVEAALNT